MYPTRLSKGSVLAAALALASAPMAAAQDNVLVIGTSGGAFLEALDLHFFTPFEEETGIQIIPVIASTLENTTRLRAQADASQVEFDIITSNNETVISDADILADIDCTQLANLDNTIEGTCSSKRVLRTLAGFTVVYVNEAFPDGGPSTWAEFFDAETFPGDRCLPGGSIENDTMMLAALLADGVAPEDLYPMDIDRAIAKLESIRPHVTGFFTSFSMSQQLLRDGECVASAMGSHRALSLANEWKPISFTWENALVDTGNWSIARGAPNEEAAYRFLDFWLSPARGAPRILSNF